MTKGRKALLLLCIGCALLLTACHTDADPWPASSNPTAVPTAVTEAGQTETAQTEPTNAPGDATAAPGEPQQENNTNPGLNG